MKRKLRATEVSEQVYVDDRQNGQYMHKNMFCLCCHGLNKHYPECKNHDAYAIPATAQVPNKNASRRKWKIFKDQFVFSKPIGYWFWIEMSWWYKNVFQAQRNDTKQPHE